MELLKLHHVCTAVLLTIPFSGTNFVIQVLITKFNFGNIYIRCSHTWIYESYVLQDIVILGVFQLFFFFFFFFCIGRSPVVFNFPCTLTFHFFHWPSSLRSAQYDFIGRCSLHQGWCFHFFLSGDLPLFSFFPIGRSPVVFRSGDFPLFSFFPILQRFISSIELRFCRGRCSLY